METPPLACTGIQTQPTEAHSIGIKALQQASAVVEKLPTLESRSDLLPALVIAAPLSIGVALVIITGGIDLSIGSLIALSGVLLVKTVNVRYEPSDFESRIAEIRPEAIGPFTGPSLRLEEPPPELRAGDRLSFASTSGRSDDTIMIAVPLRARSRIR